MPRKMAVQRCLARIVSCEVGEVIKTGLGLAALVVEVRDDVCAVGVARLEREGAFDVDPRAIDVAGFDLGKGKRGQEPPVVAVGVGKRGKERKLLGLAALAPAESDQSEDSRARRQCHDVARPIGDVVIDGGEGVGAVTFDDVGENGDVRFFTP